MLKALFSLFTLCGFLGFSSPARAQLSVVASDDGGVIGAQPHLTQGEIYEFPTTVVKGDLRTRTVAFGDRVNFGYEGLDPRAKYQLRATFSSDAPREMKIIAGGTAIGDVIILNTGDVITKTLDIPFQVYSKGSLLLEFQRVEGPNAVVAALEILSDSRNPLTRMKNVPSADLGAAAPSTSELEAALPAYRLIPTGLTKVKQSTLRLDGIWKFSAAPQQNWWKAPSTPIAWKPIRVPGHWVQQGFDVPKEEFAGYFRSFQVPADWRGQRVVLRFDSVFSESKIWVNGVEVGSHLGGMTRFEFDITPHLKAGANTLAVGVKSWSDADRLGSLSQYTAFPMGGILRKVQLFAIPEVNLSDLRTETRFDTSRRNATLHWQLTVNNNSRKTVNRQLIIKVPGTSVNAIVAVVKLPAGKSRVIKGVTRAGQILSWNPERPKLYPLTISLGESTGTPTFTHTEKIGFRQVQVVGNRVLVNGNPIKLRGVNRHEVDPLGGRVTSPENWRRDAQLFRAANCNFVRTSHYPPAEEFIAACDELGLFVELEAPIGWVGHGANTNWQTLDYKNPKWFPYLLQANMETIQAYRNHPSIIMWSEANESAWSNNFARVIGYMQAADPSRPQSFHDQAYGGYNNYGSITPVANIHYPGLNGPRDVAAFKRPITFGEYHHVNVYNRRDLLTDPGARDGWGDSLDKVYSEMNATPAVLGGSIWAGIDDVFYLPKGVVTGYGPWGIIDGWRREKPEFWVVKKAYSPIRIDAKIFDSRTTSIPVENRYLFTNLNQIKAVWQNDRSKGTLSLPNLPPGKSAKLALAREMTAGKTLKITFNDPRGFVADTFQFETASQEQPQAEPVAASPIKVEDTATAVSIAANDVQYSVNKTSGQIVIRRDGQTLVQGGPHLYLVPFTSTATSPEFSEKIEPLNNVGTDWKCEAVTLARDGSSAVVTIKGNYKEATGAFILTVRSNGRLQLSFDFKMRQALNPRQLGVVLDLPRNFDTLQWKRDTYWTTYPRDHIGRSQGEAHAFYSDCPLPRPLNDPTHPTWSWSHDATPLGSNDFRSTRRHIREASLLSPRGSVRLLAQGDLDVRCWVEDAAAIRFLVATMTLPMSEGFAGSYWRPLTKPLSIGSPVKGEMDFEFRNVAQ